MKKCPYFEGWYIKQQGEKGMFAVIPSFHIDKNGEKKAWIQLITDCRSYAFSFPAREYFRSKNRFLIRIGKNVFSENGIFLDLEQNGVTIHGRLYFGRFTPPSSDIMGPFRFFSMECSHGVESFCHRVDGQVVINRRIYQFENGRGYIERDSGCSFPSEYFWSHTSFGTGGKNCIMAAAARIPLPLGKSFFGCIAAIRAGNKEYRMATYRGARVVSCQNGLLVLKQGKSRLEIRGGNKRREILKAPKEGAMGRIVEEQLTGPAHYRFYYKGKCVLDRIVPKSSLEYFSNAAL